MTRVFLASLVLAAFLLPSILSSFSDSPHVEYGSGLRVASTTDATVVEHVAAYPIAAPKFVFTGRGGGAEQYPTDELLDALAGCESHMQQDAYSDPPGPAGPYLSFFQWLQGTWWSVGGEGDPRDHPYEVQRELARTLILQAGWGQFPTCSRVIGAR